MTSTTLRAELDALRAELAALKHAKAGPAAHAESQPPGEGFGKEIAELNSLVHQMLEDAEETITRHPVAMVAGALALGIVIGRLTAR